MNNEIQLYLNWKGGYAPKAALNYGLHLRRFAKQCKKTVQQVTIEDIIGFQYWMRSNFSASSVFYGSVVLQNFFKFLLRNGYQVMDPWLIRPPKYEANHHAVVSREDFETMTSSLEERSFYDLEKKLILHMLWDTGIRVSELCDLDISQIDTKVRMASIVTKKNKQWRWIMWGEATHDLLLRYLGIRICLNRQPFLFLARELHNKSARLNPRTVQRWVTDLAKQCDIRKKLTPHSFRHGKAHEILRRGGNPKEIQAILGHSENNPRAAFSYLRLSHTEFTKVAQKFL